MKWRLSREKKETLLIFSLLKFMPLCFNNDFLVKETLLIFWLLKFNAANFNNGAIIAGMTTLSGNYVPSVTIHGPCRAYVPHPLPPRASLDRARLEAALGRANRGLGALRGIRNLLSNPSHLLRGHVRREAVLSSQIEGTRSSLDDLMARDSQPAPPASRPPDDDLVESSNYADALNHGLARMRAPEPGGLPLSMRLLREMHGILLQSGRGAARNPGEFRRTQNWVGGMPPGDDDFFPPPPDRLDECVAALEKFVAAPDQRGDPLIRAGLAHAQFETIHPFLDGNGRLGRLLIVLMLINEDALDDPWLYVSLPIKKTRDEYYRRLDAVRKNDDWTGWLLYFLSVVAEAADDVFSAAREAEDLFARDRAKIERSGRRAPATLAAHDALQRGYIVSAPGLAREIGCSQPTALAAINRLIALDIVRPMDESRRRNRRFVYAAYREILIRDGEPL